MLNGIIHLTLVFILQCSVKTVSLDIFFEQEKCFLENCQSTLTLGVPYPICGTDNKPYRNWISLDCANVCAKQYGFEIRGNFKGSCPGKANADYYWSNRKIIHAYQGK
ncbi:hypothetical protein WA026_023039 [Henosepilachna vigintioctopunctata]|uniref:Kazal-like domain-containing protein n=1 Tax=Henosepilachna vigintioctopunctata TaxID=420089 RepID=A0AAW1VJE2_9CUCU